MGKAVIELHLVRIQLLRFIRHEHKHGITGGDFVATLQPDLFDRSPVDKRAVPAFQISENIIFAVPSQYTMASGQRDIADRNKIRGVSPDGHLITRKDERVILGRPSGNHYFSWVHLPLACTPV